MAGFFSIEGQLDRLKNTVSVLGAVTGINSAINSVTGSTLPTSVSANTGNKVVDAVVSTAANHPYITAAAFTPLPIAGGTSVAAKVTTATVNTIKNASPITQAGLAAGTLVTGGLISTSEKAQDIVVAGGREVLNPGNYVEFGKDIGLFIENPTSTNFKQIVQDNPVISAITGAGLAYVGGKAVIAGSNAVSNYLNTSAVKENTKATLQAVTGNNYPIPILNQSSDVVPTNPNASSLPSATDAPVAAIGKAQKAVSKRKRSPRKISRTPNINVRVNNILAEKFIY